MMADIEPRQRRADWEDNSNNKIQVMTGQKVNQVNNTNESADKVLGTIRKYQFIDLTVDDCDQTDVTNETKPPVIYRGPEKPSDANNTDLCAASRHTQVEQDKMELVSSERVKDTTVLEPSQAKPSMAGEEHFATLTLEGNVNKSHQFLRCYFPTSQSGEVFNYCLRQQLKQNDQATDCLRSDAVGFKNANTVQNAIPESTVIGTSSKHSNTDIRIPLSADECKPPALKRSCIRQNPPQSYASSNHNQSKQGLYNHCQWPSQILLKQKRANEADVYDPKVTKPIMSKQSIFPENHVLIATTESPSVHRSAGEYLKSGPMCQNMVQSDRSRSLNIHPGMGSRKITIENCTSLKNYIADEKYDSGFGSVVNSNSDRREVNQFLRNDYKSSSECKPVIMKNESGEPCNDGYNNQERLWPLTNKYNWYPYDNLENHEYIVAIKPESITPNKAVINGQAEEYSNETSSIFSSFRPGVPIGYKDHSIPTCTRLSYPGAVGVDSAFTSLRPHPNESAKQIRPSRFEPLMNVPDTLKQSHCTARPCVVVAKTNNVDSLTEGNKLERLFTNHATEHSAARDFRRTTTNSTAIPHRPWHLSLCEVIQSEMSATHEDKGCSGNSHEVIQSARSETSPDDMSCRENSKEELHPPEILRTSPQENEKNENQIDDFISTPEVDHTDFIKSIERQESIRRLKVLLQTKDAELSTLRSQRTRSSKVKSSRLKQII